MRFGKARLEQAGKTLPDGTKSRKRTRHAWYELQDTCAYHEDFGLRRKLLCDRARQTTAGSHTTIAAYYGEATTFST